MLTEQQKNEISREGEAIADRFKNINTYHTGRIQGFKDGYEGAGYKYAELCQAAEERAARAEKALRDILAWELTTGAKVKVKHLDILKDIMETANKALASKTRSDEA